MKSNIKTVYALVICANNKLRVVKDKKWQTDEIRRTLDLSNAIVVSIDANTYISYDKDELDNLSILIKESNN